MSGDYIFAFLNNNAFIITLIEITDIVIATTSGLRNMPIGTNAPAAIGMATTL